MPRSGNVPIKAASNGRAGEERAAGRATSPAKRSAAERAAAERAAAERAALERVAAAERAAAAAAVEAARQPSIEEIAAQRAANERAEARRRALVARKRRAESFPAGVAVHKVHYGALEGAPWLQLLAGDAVLMRDYPAPGYAAWAVVTRIDADGFAVMRDLSHAVLRSAAAAAAGGAMLVMESSRRPPEGYWQENACMPLRCSPSGTWALPVMTTDDVLFGLPSEDYAALNYQGERPAGYVSYACKDGRQSSSWGEEPHEQILIAARHEIGCWSAPGADLTAALGAVWPELEHGFGLIPGRPCEQLRGWSSSFLSISTPSDVDGSSRAGSRGGSGPASPFGGHGGMSCGDFVGLI